MDNFFESRQKEFVRRMEEGFKTNTNKDGDSLGVPGFREFMHYLKELMVQKMVFLKM